MIAQKITVSQGISVANLEEPTNSCDKETAH